MNQLGFISILAAGAIVYANAPLLFEKKGESYIQQSRENGGQLTTNIRTQEYTLLEFYNHRMEVETQLLDVVKDIQKVEGTEGVNAKLKLSLFSSAKEKYDTLLWQIKEDGNQWTYLESHRLLITLFSGCCGARDGARAYNITNGKLILSYTPLIEEVGSESSPFIIEIPNTDIHRFVGILSPDSSRDFPAEFVGPDSQGFQAAALLKYADEKSVKQNILIKVKMPEGFTTNLGLVRWVLPKNSKNESQGGRVTLWEIDGQAEATKIGGVFLEVRVFSGDDEKVIKIPVKGDQIDVSAAIKPADVMLVPL